MTIATHWTRVIVLSPLSGPSENDISDGLKQVFEQRDWFAIHHTDPYAAMAELCVRERSQSARSTWGVRRIEQVALVIVQSERPQANATVMDDLIRAIQTYVPHASIWRVADQELHLIYEGADGSAGEPLSEELAADQPRPSRHSIARTSSVPPLQFTERMVQSDSPQEGRRRSKPMIERVAAVAEPGALHSAPADDDDSKANTRLTRQEIDMLLNDQAPEPRSEAS